MDDRLPTLNNMNGKLKIYPVLFIVSSLSVAAFAMEDTGYVEQYFRPVFRQKRQGQAPVSSFTPLLTSSFVSGLSSSQNSLSTPIPTSFVPGVSSSGSTTTAQLMKTPTKTTTTKTTTTTRSNQNITSQHDATTGVWLNSTKFTESQDKVSNSTENSHISTSLATGLTDPVEDTKSSGQSQTTELIIGLTIGCVAFIFLLILITWLICYCMSRRRPTSYPVFPDDNVSVGDVEARNQVVSGSNTVNPVTNSKQSADNLYITKPIVHHVDSFTY